MDFGPKEFFGGDNEDIDRQPITYYLSSREVSSGPHLICNWNAKHADPLISYDESLSSEIANARTNADKVYATICNNEISVLKRLTKGTYANTESAKQSRLDKRSQTKRLEPMTMPKIVSQLVVDLNSRSQDEAPISQNQLAPRRVSSDTNPSIAPPVKKRGAYGQRVLTNSNNQEYTNDPSN